MGLGQPQAFECGLQPRVAHQGNIDDAAESQRCREHPLHRCFDEGVLHAIGADPGHMLAQASADEVVNGMHPLGAAKDTGRKSQGTEEAITRRTTLVTRLAMMAPGTGMWFFISAGLPRPSWRQPDVLAAHPEPGHGQPCGKVSPGAIVFDDDGGSLPFLGQGHL